MRGWCPIGDPGAWLLSLGRHLTQFEFHNIATQGVKCLHSGICFLGFDFVSWWCRAHGRGQKQARVSPDVPAFILRKNTAKAAFNTRLWTVRGGIIRRGIQGCCTKLGGINSPWGSSVIYLGHSLVTNTQGCRGDWISISIPIPYPQKTYGNPHGIPIPKEPRNAPYLYPSPCAFSLDALRVWSMYSTQYSRLIVVYCQYCVRDVGKL